MTALLRALPRLALAAALTALASGCGDLRDEADLQRQVAAEFRTPDTNVGLGKGATLTVTLYNSPLASPPAAARPETCRRVAEFVRDHFRGYDRLRAVQVAFGTRRAGVRVTSSTSACRFNTTDLGPAPARG